MLVVKHHTGKMCGRGGKTFSVTFSLSLFGTKGSFAQGLPFSKFLILVCRRLIGLF